MQTWPKFCGTVHYGQWDLATPISPPRSRGEWMTSWMTSWMMSWMTLCPSSTCFLLWLLPLFSTFWSFLWTGFSLWLHLTKKGLQSQCRLERYFYSWVKTNYIIAKHVYTRNLLFRSFAIACFDSGTWMDSCQEATWQVCVTELGQQLFLFISGNIQISCQLHRVCFLRYW